MAHVLETGQENVGGLCLSRGREISGRPICLHVGNGRIEITENEMKTDELVSIFLESVEFIDDGAPVIDFMDEVDLYEVCREFAVRLKLIDL